jgi:hypothetical protein
MTEVLVWWGATVVASGGLAVLFLVGYWFGLGGKS